MMNPAFLSRLLPLLIFLACTATLAIAQQPGAGLPDSTGQRDTITPLPRIKETRELKARVRAYMDGAAVLLDARPRAALQHIGDRSRLLLAIKYYLQRRGLVDERWVWTPRQIADYRKTEEYRMMVLETERVQQRFADSNPGYTLRPTSQTRSLGEQIANWNRVRSVALESDTLLARTLVELSDSSYAPLPDSSNLERFVLFLQAQDLAPPTVAVPGFSRHGQMRAIDFKIMQGSRTVAGSSSATIDSAWDGPGWTARLKEAITDASSRFIGPLMEPYEPWHYEYRPE